MVTRKNKLTIGLAVALAGAASWATLHGSGLGFVSPIAQYGTPDKDYRDMGPYLVAFDGRSRNPRWVMQRLDAASLAAHAVRDTEEFDEDSAIPQEFRPRLTDYAGSGFDRGHQAPAADHRGNEVDLGKTFSLTNIAPQVPNFNRGIWKRLEKYVRDIADDHGRTAWVCTCPLYLPERPESKSVVIQLIGKSRIHVPTHFGKALLFEDASGDRRTLAWIIPNIDHGPAYHGDVDHYRVTTDEFERAAGLDLWNKLPKHEQDELEAAQ